MANHDGQEYRLGRDVVQQAVFTNSGLLLQSYRSFVNQSERSVIFGYIDVYDKCRGTNFTRLYGIGDLLYFSEF